MIHLQGKTVCGGKAVGTAFVPGLKSKANAEQRPTDRAEELKRLENAVDKVKKELFLNDGENGSAKDIFEIHRMMLEDDDFLDSLTGAVLNEANTAEEAIAGTENYFSQMFGDTGDEYMIARIDDIRDVCGRLLSSLSDEEQAETPSEPFVLVADGLLPSELMHFRCGGLKGIVTFSGSVYSHVSILIREMCVPAIICDNAEEIASGTTVLLDADNGEVFFDPDGETEEKFRDSARSSDDVSPFASGDLPYKIMVNVGDPAEIGVELSQKCDGIGLFRTEYLYLGRKDLPGEEEQLRVYRSILEKAGGKPVTVRSFDIGSDKNTEALPLEKEDNPALGTRGLRVYTVYPEVFKTQIRALLRAAVYGDLRIMFPMVNSCGDIERINETISLAARELSDGNIPYRIPLRGAMIETPAAALSADLIAGKVDFLSIGTNDLIQYTYAVDRQNGRLERFCDPGYEAVMTLIRMTADAARRHGITSGICGELASDKKFSGVWAEIGVDYISVSPSALY